MKKLKKSELRKLIKVKSLREIGKIYGVSYERIRQICVAWGINRRGWKRIKLVDDEGKPDLKLIRKFAEGEKRAIDNARSKKEIEKNADKLRKSIEF